MRDFNALEQLTEEFFDKHWAVTEEIPYWKSDWNWEGSVPYHNKGGVYALFDEHGKVIYVGLGASTGSGIYKEHGISRRLISHVICTDRSKGNGFYKPQDHWAEVRSIAAIGFPDEYTYLAPALEDFLIRKLSPERNTVKKRTKTK